MQTKTELSISKPPDPLQMAAALKKYTKAELWAALETKCPDALAAFPRPETFEFKTNVRDDTENPALKVGFTCTRKKHKIKDVLWLEEYDTTEQDNGHRPPPLRPGEMREHQSVGFLGGYGLWYNYLHGADNRNEEKLQELYKDLFYTIDRDEKVNTKVNNARGFMGCHVFGRLAKSTSTTHVSCPFSNTIKVLFRFILLHCGCATHFEEYLNEKGNVQGLKTLVKALKKVARSPLGDTGPEKSVLVQSDSSEDDLGLFVRGNLAKKRVAEDELGSPMLKKVCTESN